LPKIQIQSQKIENNILAQSGSVSKPTRISLTPPSVIGKVVTCDIFGYNNEILFHKNEVITKSKLDKAKKHGKLSIVLFNCKDDKN